MDEWQSGCCLTENRFLVSDVGFMLMAAACLLSRASYVLMKELQLTQELFSASVAIPLFLCQGRP